MDTAYEAPVAGPAGALCANCHSIKTLDQFKRWLTKAQARARGYSGEHRVMIDSTLCKDCQPRRKALSELTNKELHNRGANGDIHVSVVRDLLKVRKEVTQKKRALSTQKRWNAERAKTWQEPRDALGREITRAVQQAKHIRNDADKEALHGFLKDYLGVLRLIRNHLDILQFDRYLRAAHADWQMYATDEQLRQTRQQWEAVPLDQRMAVRKMPELVTWRPELAQSAPNAPTLALGDRAATSDHFMLPSEKARIARQQAWEKGELGDETPAAKPQSADTTPWEDL